MGSAPFNAATPPPDLMLGAVLLDRYRVIRRLGAGGMGVVYEGEHVRIRRRVAIKCLHAAYAQNPDVLARFHREALAATAIGNEHIVEVIDMDRLPDGTVFLVLEYLDGRELGRELNDLGSLPLARAVHILSQMCEALAVAHAKGVVHRDLKPDNVYLVTRGGDADFVKILDFGISKFRDVGEGGQALTATGSILGTPRYMAPEQFADTRTVDQRADIYALGGILFRALTGRTPFQGKTLEAILGEVLHAPLPDLRTLRPDLPAGLAEVVRRMLARWPEERFADCDAVRAALRPFADFAERPDLPPSPWVDRHGHSAGGVTPPSIAPPLVAPADDVHPRSSPRTHADPPRREAPPAARFRGGWAVLGVAGLALVATLARVLTRTPAPTPQGSPPPTVTPVRPTPPPTPSPGLADAAPFAAAVPSATPPVREVRIRIRSTPGDAELYFDSHRIMNPFDGEMPATDAPHRLEARRAGYRTVVIPDLVLAFPQSVEIPMARGSGEERRVTRASRARGGGTPVVVATHVEPEREPPVAAPPQAPPVAAPAPGEPHAAVGLPPPPPIRDPL